MSSFLSRSAFAAPRFARAFSNTPARSTAKIQIIGNIATAPELQATSTGREILKYTVVSNRGRGDAAKASFFRISSFESDGPRRDYFLGLPKGTLVFVEGDASLSTYEEAEGNKKTVLNITQRSLEVLRRAKSESGESGESGESQ